MTSLFLLLTNIFLNNPVLAATSVKKGSVISGGSIQTVYRPSSSWVWQLNAGMNAITVNGDTAYCLEPARTVETNNATTVKLSDLTQVNVGPASRPDDPKVNLTSSMKNKIILIANYGYGYPGHNSAKYQWAIKYDLVDKDYSRYIELSKHKNKNPNKRNILVFTQEQIETMWKIKDTNEYYKVVLMLIYTGTRIQEMLTLKKENVNIEEQYFKVKESKTEAGIRKVPIADAIVPFFKHWMNNSDSEYLITTKDREQMLYSNYLNAYWKPILEPLGWKQTPHHARHTCVTLLTEARVEPTFIKLIVGHEGAMSLTERVYTHISNEPLLESVNKMFVPNI